MLYSYIIKWVAARSVYLISKVIKPILCKVNKLNVSFHKDYIEISNAHEDVKNWIMFLVGKIMKPVFVERV